MQKHLLPLFILFTNIIVAQRPDYLKKDSIPSSLDGNTQVFYYDKSTATTPQPLVIELHSWSNTAESQKTMVAEQKNLLNLKMYWAMHGSVSKNSTRIPTPRST